MKKKQFNSIEIEIVFFEEEDVIHTSPIDGTIEDPWHEFGGGNNDTNSNRNGFDTGIF